MQKKAVSLCFALLLAMSAFAQSVMDPSDSVYADIREWQTAGVLGLLPQMRPYPAQVVRDILNKVVSDGNEIQSRRAKYQLGRLFGPRPVVGVKAEAAINAGSDGLDKQGVGGVFASGVIEPIENTTIAFDVNIIATNKKNDTLITPAYMNSKYDLIDDPMTITSSISGFFLGNAQVAYGTSDAYIMAGLNRSSWGDFFDDSIVISPEAFHAGSITAAINRETWNYSLSLLALSATDNVGNGSYPEKFLALHSITFQPVKKLDITFFETVMYGQRLETLYLIPVVPMMISQGMAGFNDDNLMMGLAFKFRPVNGLNWNTNVMVDDVNLNELIKLDFNTQMKLAAQTGIVWSTGDALVSSVAFDYTAVMPYMYTHSTDDCNATDVNYMAYTNKGISLGSQLQPNSDCINVKTTIHPMDTLDVVLGAAFIRHANVNESLTDADAIKYLENGTFVTDGGVYNYPDAGSGYLQWAKNNFLFLDQETKEYTLRGSIDATWTLPREEWGQISVNAGYVCEYIINYGVGSSIYSGKITGATAADVAAAKAAWKAKLKNVLNNYFTLGVKYSW